MGIAICLVLIGGCGLKGDLYLPEDAEPDAAGSDASGEANGVDDDDADRNPE
jgi:predicted small lipoprotein YifL